MKTRRKTTRQNTRKGGKNTRKGGKNAKQNLLNYTQYWHGYMDHGRPKYPEYDTSWNYPGYFKKMMGEKPHPAHSNAENTYIFTRHGYSCANLLKSKKSYQQHTDPDPSLTQYGILSILKTLQPKPDNYNGIVFVSPLIRTWQTAILEYGLHGPLTLVVSPYIKEKHFKYFKFLDVSNMPLPLGQQLAKMRIFFDLLYGDDTKIFIKNPVTLIYDGKEIVLHKYDSNNEHEIISSAMDLVLDIVMDRNRKGEESQVFIPVVKDVPTASYRKYYGGKGFTYFDHWVKQHYPHEKVIFVVSHSGFMKSILKEYSDIDITTPIFNENVWKLQLTPFKDINYNYKIYVIPGLLKPEETLPQMSKQNEPLCHRVSSSVEPTSNPIRLKHYYDEPLPVIPYVKRDVLGNPVKHEPVNLVPDVDALGVYTNTPFMDRSHRSHSSHSGPYTHFGQEEEKDDRDTSLESRRSASAASNASYASAASNASYASAASNASYASAASNASYASVASNASALSEAHSSRNSAYSSREIKSVASNPGTSVTASRCYSQFIAFLKNADNRINFSTLLDLKDPKEAIISYIHSNPTLFQNPYLAFIIIYRPYLDAKIRDLSFPMTQIAAYALIKYCFGSEISPQSIRILLIQIRDLIDTDDTVYQLLLSNFVKNANRHYYYKYPPHGYLFTLLDFVVFQFGGVPFNKENIKPTFRFIIDLVKNGARFSEQIYVTDDTVKDGMNFNGCPDIKDETVTMSVALAPLKDKRNSLYEYLKSNLIGDDAYAGDDIVLTEGTRILNSVISAGSRGTSWKKTSLRRFSVKGGRYRALQYKGKRRSRANRS